VRKLGGYEAIATDNPRFYRKCFKCKKETGHIIDKLCSICFLEREKKKGCICFYEKHKDDIGFYCSLCEEVHFRYALCKQCFEKQTKYNENKRIFFRIILPTSVVSLIIGFFLG